MLTRVADVRRDGAGQRFNDSIAKEDYTIEFDTDDHFVLPYTPILPKKVERLCSPSSDSDRESSVYTAASTFHRASGVAVGSAETSGMTSSTESVTWDDFSDDELPPDSMFFQPVDSATDAGGEYMWSASCER